MPSPFPGMNPYLESPAFWASFHTNFLVQLQTLLVPQVQPKYSVDVEVRLNLHERSAEERRFIGAADVGIAGKSGEAARGSTALQAAPVRLILPAVEVQKQRYLVVRDREKLVTVIKVLSPSNKNSGDGDDYQRKRLELLRTEVNFVEIDLLRGGRRHISDDMPDCNYCVLVSSPTDRPEAAFWPIGLRDRLPVIPVPLHSADQAATIDLKNALDRSYDSAGFADRIYERNPEPPLSTEDDAWARGIADNELKSQIA